MSSNNDFIENTYLSYCRDISKYPLLSSQEETVKLCLLAQQGDIEARNKIVCAYALFVVSNVNRWFSKYDKQTKLDLIQV